MQNSESEKSFQNRQIEQIEKIIDELELEWEKENELCLEKIEMLEKQNNELSIKNTRLSEQKKKWICITVLESVMLGTGFYITQIK